MNTIRWFTVIIIAGLLAGCATPTPLAPAPTTPPQPTQAPPTGGVEEMPGGPVAARKALAEKLGLKIEQIIILRFESMQWPDGCLGVQKPGIACIQVITPGYRVYLRSGDQQYTYHTNLAGTAVVEAAVAPFPSVNPLLTWQRIGGIAGFCDELKVLPEGKATYASCKSAPSNMAAEKTLTELDINRLRGLIDQYQAFDWKYTDPATADAMTTKLSFGGRGAKIATPTEQQEIAQFAVNLLAWMAK